MREEREERHPPRGSVTPAHPHQHITAHHTHTHAHTHTHTLVPPAHHTIVLVPILTYAKS